MKAYNQLDKYERRDLYRRGVRRLLKDTGWMTNFMERNKALTVHMKQGEQDLFASVRTSSDQWLGFGIEKDTQRYLGDEILKDQKTHVVIAVPDSVDAPSEVLVYLVSAADLEKCFKANYDAHKRDQRLPKHTSMWISLFASNRKGAGSAGSGILDKIKPLGRVAMRDLLIDGHASDASHIKGEGMSAAMARPETIADVLRDAKERIARIAGVPVDDVRLDVKFGS